VAPPLRWAFLGGSFLVGAAAVVALRLTVFRSAVWTRPPEPPVG
jgi:hypothetical protein